MKPNVDPADLPDDVGVTVERGGGNEWLYWWTAFVVLASLYFMYMVAVA